MIPDNELDALEALAKAATPGIYEACKNTLIGSMWVILQGENPAAVREHSAIADMIGRDEDARCIAAACNAVPALIAEVRELRRERDEEMLSNSRILLQSAETQETLIKAVRAIGERDAALSDAAGLRAENARLQRERDEWHDAAARAHDALTDLDVSERAALTEAADLRAENERLRTALQRLHNNVGVPWMRAAAREALRGK